VKTHCSRCINGSSLLEVLIALALTAVTMISAVAGQLGALRAEKNAAHWEQGVVIAHSVAEAMHAPETAAEALTRWQARAESVLPSGAVSIVDQGGDVALAVVTWSGRRGSASIEPAVAPECAHESEPDGIFCVAMPFAR
jgi:Tfp pilus assembly protein PilV